MLLFKMYLIFFISCVLFCCDIVLLIDGVDEVGEYNFELFLLNLEFGDFVLCFFVDSLINLCVCGV